MIIKTDEILFSVIICNYNYGAFLRKAIDSVLKQTYTNFELIIVDDGSTDESRDIIKSYNDNRLIAIFQDNSGQASSFNAGFNKSNGEIICFLDSDDWWNVDKIETVLKWHNVVNSNYSILQHNLLVWCNGETYPYKLTLPTGNCFAEMCKSGNIDFFVPTSGLSIPRKVCEKVFPIPVALKICADAFMTRSSLVFGDLISIPTSHGYYRKHQNTVYNNDSFVVDEFFNNKLFPLLEEFYSNNNIRVPKLKYCNSKLQVTRTRKIIDKYVGKLISSVVVYKE